MKLYKPIMLAAALVEGMVVPVLAQHPAAGAISALSNTNPAKAQGDFYVATDGKDSWSGTLPASRADGADGPFATLAQARDAVKDARAKDAVPRAYTVVVRGGFYPLAETLVFKPEDSAPVSAPTTYTAWPGEKPVLSGGRRVTGWQKSADGNTWTAVVPEVRDGEFYSTQLFVNGERRQRARYPNEGCLKADDPPRFSEAMRVKLMTQGYAGVKFKSKDDLGKVAMGYKDGDIQHWENPEDVNLFQLHSWTSPLRWIAEIDEARRTVLFTGSSRFPALRWKGRMPYYFVENAREFLDSPGEWYLDRKTGVLTYRPREGEEMELAETVVSALPALIRIEGVCAAGHFVDGLVFRGLSFRHTDWGPLDRAGETDGYSSVHFLPAVIEAKGLRFCIFEQCEITCGGGYALYLIDGSASNCVQQCEIHDMGGGGILIGSRWSNVDLVKNPLPPDDASDDLLSRHNVVDNCFFHDNGRVFPGVIGGVFIAHAPFNRVTHNEICNLPYSGITVGRRLDFKYSHAHHNEVAYNHIHHIGAGTMSDMGGIYTEGVSPGTRLHHNLIHDVNYFDYAAFGIYCDQGSSQIQIDHNICYNCMDGGYMQNGAITDNVIRNNIFTLNTVAGQINNGFKSDASMIVERNIIDTSNGEVLSRYWDAKRKFKFNHNLYHSADGELRFGDWSWQEWQALGQDRDSIVADPMFFDKERHDFRLRPGSPAEKIGFEPFDLSSAGLYGDPEWISAPSKIPAQVFKRIAPRLTRSKKISNHKDLEL